MSEQAWESFRGSWGGEVTFHYEPDPALIATQIEELELGLRDFSLPLRAARTRMIGNTQQAFETETEPGDGHWAPWAESYRPRAEAENIGILRKTEDLFEAATSHDSYEVVGNDLWLQTGNFPDYWAVHQYGHTWQKGGTPITVPARPYLALDEETQIEIIDIFDAWFSSRVTMDFRPLFGGGVSVRGAGGRFRRFE